MEGIRKRILSGASSKANIGIGNDDVWFEILKRLPLKDILRCRCVCRTWCSMVASSIFINEHLNSKLHKLENGDGDGGLLLFRQSGLPSVKRGEREQAKFSLLDSKTLSPMSRYFYCPIMPVNNPCFQIVGSVHGLICLLDNNSAKPTEDVTLLWNPSVYRYFRLPQPPSNLNHDHTKRHYHFSFLRFTFNPIKKDYMVVRVMYCYTHVIGDISEPPVVEFYSFGNREWKTVSSTSLHKPYVIVEDSCSQYRSSVDGAVCWIAWKRGSSVLVLFSAVEYELKVLALPEQLGSHLNPVFSRVVEFKGLLTVMDVSIPVGVELALSLWSWIDKEDQWCQMISISTAVDGMRVGEYNRLMIVYRVTDDGCVIGARGVLGRKYELILFNPQTNQIDTLWEHSNGCGAEYMGSYMQSLLLLDDESGALSYDPTTIPRLHQPRHFGPLQMDLRNIYSFRCRAYDPGWYYTHDGRRRSGRAGESSFALNGSF